MSIKRISMLVSVAFALLIGASGAVGLSKTAALTSAQAACQGAGAASSPDSNQTNQGCADSGANVNGILKWVLNILSIVVGIIAVIFIIIGGLKIITSGGDSSNVASGKNTILYAVVGLIIVALAQIIVQFVIKKGNDAINKTTFVHIVENVKEFMV